MTQETQSQNLMFETMQPTRLFIRCAVPSMISMAITSIYTITDGIFVGRFIGAEALAAINLVMPIIAISFALSDMIAVGSSVQISIRLGEKKNEEAGIIFTICSLIIICISAVIGLLGYFIAEPLVRFMGADQAVTDLAAQYIKVFAVFAPFILVFFAIDNYLRVCGHVHYSMAINITAAVVNIILDYLFLAVLHLGIDAAAFATCLSFTLGTIIGYIPFIRKKLPLRFVKGKIKSRVILNIIYNGSSEFFSNIAGSILMLILNSILLHISGSMAVAAFSVVLYVDSIVASILYGMTDSLQPSISYCYGAKLRKRMFSMEKRVLIAGAVISLTAFIFMRYFGSNIISLFIKEDNPSLLEMSLTAMQLYSFTYLISWIDVGLTAFFTALNKPGISLSISIGRSLIFPLTIIWILVYFFGLNGVWLTAAAGNTMTAATAIFFLLRFLKKERLKKEDDIVSL